MREPNCSDFFCPHYDKCIICKENIMHEDLTGFKYRTMYCLRGKESYSKCSRFEIINAYGIQAPVTILPDTDLKQINVENLLLCG